MPITTPPQKIVYPESDGEPIADNSLQFRWIVTIEGNIEHMYRDDPDVFVAGDMLWYPVEGDNKTRAAPDTMVAFGRPKGYRGSYRQWEEGGIAPQVAFEVASPGNRIGEMTRKFQFYEKHGVEEYYLYEPFGNTLDGWQRRDGKLVPIENMQGWVSPRLGIRFEMKGEELAIYRPDGKPFLTFDEVCTRNDESEQKVKDSQRQLEESKARAEEDRLARLQAQARADAAQQQATAAQQQAATAQQRADALAAKLRALGIDPNST